MPTIWIGNTCKVTNITAKCLMHCVCLKEKGMQKPIYSKYRLEKSNLFFTPSLIYPCYPSQDPSQNQYPVQLQVVSGFSLAKSIQVSFLYSPANRNREASEEITQEFYCGLSLVQNVYLNHVICTFQLFFINLKK